MNHLEKDYELSKENFMDEINHLEDLVQKGNITFTEAINSIEIAFKIVIESFDNWLDETSEIEHPSMEKRFNFWRGYCQRAVDGLQYKRLVAKSKKATSTIVPKEERADMESAEEGEPSSRAVEEEEPQQPSNEETIPVHLRKAQLLINLAETYRKLADIEMETTVNEKLCETQTESV